MMEAVKIPTKVLLDAMLQQLHLPAATYSTQKARTMGLDATVQFYGSKHELDNGFPGKSVSTYVYDELSEAEDRLAYEALKIMKGTYGKVLQDYNYVKLQLVDQQYASLERQENEKDNIIGLLSNSWCNNITKDQLASDELYRIINNNFSPGSTPQDNELNHVLTQVRYVADHLSDAAIQSEEILQKTKNHYWSLDDDVEGVSALGDTNPWIEHIMHGSFDERYQQHLQRLLLLMLFMM